MLRFNGAACAAARLVRTILQHAVGARRTLFHDAIGRVATAPWSGAAARVTARIVGAARLCLKLSNAERDPDERPGEACRLYARPSEAA